MFSRFQLAKKFIQYYIQASNSRGHGMHSPFVFDFILYVLNNKKKYQAPPEIENLRNQLIKNRELIENHDLGAGSATGFTDRKSVGAIARSALKSKMLAHVLFRLVKHYQPSQIIELGTSLGLTTAYFSKANPSASIISIEGNPQIAALARENLAKLQCYNTEVITGNFDDLLPAVLRNKSSIDLVYIDGNHRYEPTMNYFHQCLEHVHPATILVFDDIHWSEEMEKAWSEIKSDTRVIYTIDIFFLGFVFFRNEFKVKQNFSIRY